MQKEQYKTFSLGAHKKNWKNKKPSVCQFELTFKCGLHCSHCYTDCYNKPSLIKKELDTRRIKSIIDKLYDLGILWLCFTGGDPLERGDFLEIYSYAKKRGFLITIFTTGYSMTGEIAGYLEKMPPFVIEITVNGSQKETYEKVTQVAGSFEKAMKGLNLILRKNLPLKVKTMALSHNFEDLAGIKDFLAGNRIKFRPSALLHARLNGDKSPCGLRLEPEEINKVDKLFALDSMEEDDDGAEVHNIHKRQPVFGNRLFQCAMGSTDGLNLDPYGNMFPCACIRNPAVNFLDSDPQVIKKIIFQTFPKIAGREFKTISPCRNCDLKSLCLKCPGKALLETGDMEAPVEYFCELARFSSNKNKRNTTRTKKG
jgi:radical SAM protein with 4Fe4S-binding SPASM domain